MAALNTVSSTTPAASTASSREAVARPAAEDKSIVDRFTDTVSFDNLKNVATDVVDAGDDLLDQSIKELKTVVGGFLGWMGLSMLSEMTKLDEKARERRRNEAVEAAIEDGRRAANAAQARSEDKNRRQAAAA